MQQSPLKKGLFLFFFLVVLFFILSSSINASPGLIENKTWQQNLTGVLESSIILGDIDNDGDLDLALTGKEANNYHAKIYENNGTSFDENKTWQQNLTGVWKSSTAFGDIDNDGDLDLILTGNDGNSGITKIYENNGTAFRENIIWYENLTTTNIYNGAVAFGDIDNDGDLDLAVIGADSSNENGIYINNGTSFVKSSSWLASLPLVGQGDDNGAGIVFGDIDNDGDLDLVMVGSYGTDFYRQVHINNGTSLIENSAWEDDFDNIFGESSLSFGDFDNDGDLDLAIIGLRAGDHLYILVNNRATFIKNQTEDDPGPLVGIYDGSIGFGDFDNDGDLDLAALGLEAGRALVYSNNDTKFNRDATVYSNISNYLAKGALAWGDVDNDSALDLVIASRDRLTGFTEVAKVYSNNITTTNTQPNPPAEFQNYSTSEEKFFFGWGNGSDAETPVNGLYYNLRIGTSSSGNQIVSGKYGGGEDNGYFGNMMQRRNITLKTDRFKPNTTYYWSVQTIDTALKTSSWSLEQTFTSPSDIIAPNITLNAPINNYNTTDAYILFNATVFDNRNVTNVTLYGNWSGWHLNETNSSGINNTDYLFNKSFTDGFYSWYLLACDNSTLCTNSTPRIFLRDATDPLINLISPSNSSTLSSNEVTFNYNVSDLDISNCSLIIDGDLKQTDYSVATYTTITFSQSLVNGNYNWLINCTDELNQRNSSTKYKLTVSYNPVTGGISGGGGRSISAPPLTTKGISIQISKGESRFFKFNNINYEIKINKILEDAITLSISDLTFTIKVGEAKEIDLDKDGKNDISVDISSIVFDKIVNIEIKKIIEVKEKPEEKIIEEIKEEILLPEKEVPYITEEVNLKTILFTFLILIFIILTYLWVFIEDFKKIYLKK